MSRPETLVEYLEAVDRLALETIERNAGYALGVDAGRELQATVKRLRFAMEPPGVNSNELVSRAIAVGCQIGICCTFNGATPTTAKVLQ